MGLRSFVDSSYSGLSKFSDSILWGIITRMALTAGVGGYLYGSADNSSRFFAA